MEAPLVSVICCTYNSKEFIQFTLDSIINQSYTNLEILVVDDCSNDSTRDILEEYKKRNQNLKTIYLEKNLHVCNAANTAYKIAHGKYIALIGHDDIWQPDKIEKQVDFMENNAEYAVCFTKTGIINGEGKPVEKNSETEDLWNIFQLDNKSRMEWANLLLYGNIFCAGSSLIRKECLGKDELYRYGLIQLQDYELWLRLIKDYSFYIYPEQLTFYRWFGDEKKNLSFPTILTSNRACHETEYILYHYIKHLPDSTFEELYHTIFRNKMAGSHYELICERGFLLKELNCCHWTDYFIEKLEDEKFREVLSVTYDYTLQNFYQDNTISLMYDKEMYCQYTLQKYRADSLENQIQQNQNQQNQNEHGNKKKAKYYLIHTINRTITADEFIPFVWTKILYAVSNGMIPVIDTKYFPIQILRKNGENPFYSYFSIASQNIHIDELYGMENEVVEMSGPGLLDREMKYFFDFNQTNWISEENLKILCPVFNQFMGTTKDISKIAEDFWELNLLDGKKVLGVCFPAVDKPDAVQLIIEFIRTQMMSYGYEAIFAANANDKTRKYFMELIGIPVVSQKQELDKLEMTIVEAEILSKCESLVGDMNVVTSMAILRNACRYEFLDVMNYDIV